jgi:betaPIX coiled coil
LLENPQVLIAEEEKIIVEEIKGDETVVEEKLVWSIFDLVISFDVVLCPGLVASLQVNI